MTLTEGTTFCISDSRGDVATGWANGLFVRDTRMLSRWRLEVNGAVPEPLSVHRHSPFAATFVTLSPGGGPVDGDSPDLVVTRRRLVGEGLREDITVRNTRLRAVQLRVRLEVGADFADLFEVKEGRVVGSGAVRATPGSDQLDLSVLRAGDEYGVTLVSDAGATARPDALEWSASLGGHASWATTVQAIPRLRGRRLEVHHRPGVPEEHSAPARRRREFAVRAPRLATADPGLAAVLGRSIEDLGTLRIFDPDHPDLPVIAAGAPWFMALFGRDSLLTSLMVMPVDASLALGTLTTLGAHQGVREDPMTEEEPGKILHEMRFGPAGTLALDGRNAYYGSVDATPLFVMVLGELHRWHPEAVTPELVAHADRALDWVWSHGDADGDGFVEYSRRTDRGLANQGWKDSGDGINYADGTIAHAPLALAEVQAYVYGALVARAEIADARGEESVAGSCRDRAARLKAAFNEAFWLPDSGWYAVALDEHKRPVDALTSNVGHCLWTGIADEGKAHRVAAHLMSPDMFTGWGIRTLSASMGAYNPMSYHNGSVWPHDTAICAAGLARYGHTAEAGQVALGLLDAADFFGHGLPELFAGFGRDDLPAPVPYPAACSPQAWASAAPVALLTAMLGLAPAGGVLRCAPSLPDRLVPLVLEDLTVGGRHYRLRVDEDGTTVQTEPGNGR